jgi:endonuclease/exonuclease/phosphatase (EEP) superfamily protein YafD
MTSRARHGRRRPSSLRRLLAATIWSWSLAMLAGAALQYALGDATALGVVLAFAPHHWFVAPGLLLVPMAPLAGWRATLGALAGAAVGFLALGGGAIGWHRAIAPDERPLRIVTFNIDGQSALAAQLRADIPRWNADALLVQSCNDEIEEMLRAIGGHRTSRAGEFCMFTPHRVRRIELINWSSDEGANADRPSIRSPAARYLLDVRGTTLTLVQVHMPSPRNGFGRMLRSADPGGLAPDRERRASASRDVSRWVGRAEPRLVVAGDFNLTPGSRILRDDWGHLRDAFREVGLGFGFTMAAGPFRTRIDRVLAGPAVRPLSVTVVRGYVTEHRPLLVDLGIR